MRFSVIIPTCHRNELLKECLKKLAPGIQTLASNQYEVIITDDGRSTTAEELVSREFPWAKWVSGPGKGPAANRNYGANIAKGDFLAFTDDDCLPDQEWLSAFENAIVRNAGVKIFEGRTYADSLQKSLSQTAPINLNGGKLFSCNLCIDRSEYLDLGGFDEDFTFSYEDMEFAHRLRTLGKVHLFVNNASVCHPWRDMKNSSWKSSINQSKGIRTFLKKYPDVLLRYNSLFFLKELPASLIRDLIPKLVRYRFRGASVILVHSTHYLYMAFKLFIPTVTILLKRRV